MKTKGKERNQRMVKKVRITEALASKHPWDLRCGCPLYHAMERVGIPVLTIDSTTGWTDLQGKKHKFEPAFSVADYARLLLDGKPRVITIYFE